MNKMEEVEKMGDYGFVNVEQDVEKRCQEGVKKVPQTDVWGCEVSVTPEMLKSLRLELGESLTEFGLTLKRAMDPRAERGFTRQYVSALEHGKDVITVELAAAFYCIAAVLDEVPAGLGGAVVARVFAQPGQGVEGAFVPRVAKVVRCARAGCGVLFVKVHPRQRFHDAECRLKA